MGSKMPGDQVQVTSLVDGERADAVRLKCVDCGRHVFLALLIGTAAALHLQCAACGTSHCAHDSPCH
jgi:hypothetical protein